MHLFDFIIRMKCDITFIGVEIWIMVCLLVIHFCLVEIATAWELHAAFNVHTEY